MLVSFKILTFCAKHKQANKTKPFQIITTTLKHKYKRCLKMVASFFPSLLLNIAVFILFIYFMTYIA